MGEKRKQSLQSSNPLSGADAQMLICLKIEEKMVVNYSKDDVNNKT